MYLLTYLLVCKKKKKKYYGIQWFPTTFLVTNIIQNIFFCVSQKKETHIGM